MNAERRKQISKVIDLLYDLDGIKDDAMSYLEDVKDEEQDAYDNLPESLQGSDRGCEMEENVDALENAISDIDALDIQGIIDALEELC